MDIKGKKTGGKQKGFEDQKTFSFKEAWFIVFDRMGGPEGFYKWASEGAANKRIFYQMGKAMLPKEIYVKNGDTPDSLPFKLLIEKDEESK